MSKSKLSLDTSLNNTYGKHQCDFKIRSKYTIGRGFREHLTLQRLGEGDTGELLL